MSTMSEAAEAGPSLPPSKRLHLMGEEECAEVGDILLEKSPTEEGDQHMEDEEEKVQHMDEEEIDFVDSDEELMKGEEFCEYIRVVKESEGYDCRPFKGSFFHKIKPDRRHELYKDATLYALREYNLIKNTHLELHDIERVNMQSLNVARAFVTCKVRDMSDSGSIKTFQCRVHYRVHGLAVEQARLKPVAGSEIVNDSIEEDEKPKMATPFDVDRMQDHDKYIQLVKESAGYHCGLSKYHDDNQMSERERIKFYIFVWEPLKRYKDKQRSSDDVMTEQEYLEYLQRVKESEGYDCGMCKGYFDGMILEVDNLYYKTIEDDVRYTLIQYNEREKTRLMFEEIEKANLQVAGIARYFVTSRVKDIDGSKMTFRSRILIKANELDIEQCQLIPDAS
ncbi:hypothetical protein OROMI_019097 [Orobanche minor]